MSKIPYIFDTPIPVYFRLNGWFKPTKGGRHLKIMQFLIWAFSRCSSQRRITYHDHKEIILEPYEFIFGRHTCSEETGLSEQEIKTIINQLFSSPNGTLLEKTTNSVTNRFTCYKWVTSRFSENTNQLINQPTTNRQPTDNHNLEERSKNIEEEEQTHGLRAVGCDVFIPISFEKEEQQSKRIVVSRSNEDHSDELETNKPYGEEGTVMLTPRQHQDLLNHMTETERTYWIEQMTLEIGKQGKTNFNKRYRSHYHTIKSWKIMRDEKNGQKTAVSRPASNVIKFEDAKREKMIQDHKTYTEEICLKIDNLKNPDLFYSLREDSLNITFKRKGAHNIYFSEKFSSDFFKKAAINYLRRVELF